MTHVGRIADFPKNCHVAQFFGKTYEDAIANADKSGEFVSYYSQIMCGKSKSILVSY